MEVNMTNEWWDDQEVWQEVQKTKREYLMSLDENETEEKEESNG